MVRGLSPSARLVYSLGGTQKYGAWQQAGLASRQPGRLPQPRAATMPASQSGLAPATWHSSPAELPVGEASVDVIFARMEEVKARWATGWAGHMRWVARPRRLQRCCSGMPTRQRDAHPSSRCSQPSPPHAHFRAPSRSRQLDLLDWGVSNATLEEVFIRITRDAQAGGGGGGD